MSSPMSPPSAPSRLPPPLAGLTVVEMGHWGAAPFCACQLADMGADVIKLEGPRHFDEARRVARPVEHPEADGYYFLGVNRNKRSLCVDLKSAEGLAVAQDLLGRADVFVENYRPGVVDSLGIGYEAMARRNPRLVYCSISAFGQSGPLRDKPGMDIVVQAMGGVMSLTGEEGRPPVRVGASMADWTAGWMSCVGILGALHARERYGFGQKVDISLLDGQVSLLSNYVPGFFRTGEPSRPFGSGHPQFAPYEAFATRDGYMIVGCLTEAFWRALCKLLGRTDLPADPRFVDNDSRTRHREELHALLEAHFLTRPRAEWAEAMKADDIPCAPIARLEEVLDSPQIRHNGMIETVVHPVIGEIKVAGIPIRLDRTPGSIRRPPPLLGEHSRDILAELGYPAERIAALLRSAAVRSEVDTSGGHA